jgi:hypothetical protein
MRLKAAFTTVFVIVTFWAAAQSNYAPLNEDYYQRIDRYEIKSGKVYPQVFTGIKPYKRSATISFIDSANADGVFDSKSDAFNQQYLQNDSWEWSNQETAESKKAIAKHFYKKKSDLYHISAKDFDLHVSPVLYVGAGMDSRRDDNLFTNTRGVELRGMIDNKVGFYTYLTDNQMILPSYVTDQMTSSYYFDEATQQYKLKPVVPHEGFWKNFKQGSGVDFLQARGYITFDPTKHINVQFGHDRFFIGNGYRSLIYSDNPPPALFVKTNVQVWKINYFFLINRFTADVEGGISGLTASGRYPDKFMALHHLSINVGKKLTLGIFESVMFGSDSITQGKFDIAYANPIIFYRAIEQQNGSSDNVLLGLDFKWNAIKKVQLYGQLTLDEFVLDNIKKGNGWWGNKYGAQLGLKYIDAFGVSNLDVQGELNIVRPYTYSHNTTYGSYTSYRQSLAHPLGANFKEVVGIIRYQPVPKLTIAAKLILTQAGRDTLQTKSSWGGDILKLNTNRVNDFNNSITQGIEQKITYGSLTASWMLKHNLFLDANLIVRNSESSVNIYQSNTTITSVALRWNIAQRHYDF